MNDAVPVLMFLPNDLAQELEELGIAAGLSRDEVVLRLAVATLPLMFDEAIADALRSIVTAR